MKAATITSYRSPLSINNIDDPEPGPKDAIVKVEACGICRSDWHFWQEDWTWLNLGLELPRVPGHEFGGVVEEVGKEVKNIRPGDRVSATFHLACGNCEFCLSGRGNLCYAFGFIGFHHDGGYAEYSRVSNADFNLVKLPEGVDSATAAALGCRYMTAYRAVVDKAMVRPDEWVVVVGMGGVGLALMQIAKAVGARVIAVSRSQEKLDIATKQGALATVQANGSSTSETVKEITKGGADVSFDAYGGSETMLPAILSLKKGGRHVQVGMTSKGDAGMMSIPADAMLVQEITWLSSLGCPTTSYPGLLNMVADGTLKPEQLVNKRVPVEEVNDILSDMTDFKTIGLNIIDRW